MPSPLSIHRLQQLFADRGPQMWNTMTTRQMAVTLCCYHIRQWIAHHLIEERAFFGSSAVRRENPMSLVGGDVDQTFKEIPGLTPCLSKESLSIHLHFIRGNQWDNRQANL